jgi:hypothetical protein
MANDRSQNYNQYFATLNPEKLCSEILWRVEDYDKYVYTTDRLSLWAKVYHLYNNGVYKGGRLNRLGEQAEYTEIYINHLRNLFIHILNLTTSQRATFEARAGNTDHKSQAQTIVANGILDYYSREKGIDDIAKKAVENVLQFGDSYIYQGWDFGLGDNVQPDPENPGKMIKSGDVFHKNFTPLDVMFDVAAGLHDSKKQWYIIRDFQNKWDLCEKYPELRDKILRYSNDSQMWQYMRVGYQYNAYSDYVPVFIFFHERTDSLPDGRIFSCIGHDCWMIDTPLPSFYKKIPIYRLCASEQCGSGFGYTVGYDLCPIQEAYNGLNSTIITNQSTFGVQNIIMPKGNDISVAEIADGLNLISYDSKLGKPEVLQLLSSAPEIFNYIEKLEKVMETISGVNSVARGNPESSLKSGSALALVQSMSIQFISGLQQSYVKLLEDMGNGLINILKANANVKRVVDIVGKNNKSYLREFDKTDIEGIQRVTVDIGNPLSRTTAGKVNMADQLLANGMVETPAQYLQVISTGKLEPLIEGKQSELMLIRSENESMSEGKVVQATIIDNHPLHIMEHKCVMASPESRQNPRVINATLSHIMEHINLWKTGDPALLAMLGQPTPPPLIQGSIPQEGEAVGSPSKVETGADKALSPVNPSIEAAEQTKMPLMPKNPMTGERAQI